MKIQSLALEGAGNGAVFQVVIVEGVLIGVLSWAIGAVLAIPVGQVIANAVGKTKLNTSLSHPGLLLASFSGSPQLPYWRGQLLPGPTSG